MKHQPGHGDVLHDLELSAVEKKRVIPLTEAARLRGISLATLKRQAKAGIGPEIIRLSERRLGMRLCDALAVFHDGDLHIEKPTPDVFGDKTTPRSKACKSGGGHAARR